MAGLVPATPTRVAPNARRSCPEPVAELSCSTDRDGRDKPGHDTVEAGVTYWLYMLASRPGGALYVGVTNDLSFRVWTHKQRRGGLHTRRYSIDRLVYYEAYDDVRAAIQRERNMKHWPRTWKCNLILAMNPAWRDLYEGLNGAPDPSFRTAGS